MSRKPNKTEPSGEIRPLGVDEIEAIAGAGAPSLGAADEGNAAAPAAPETTAQPADTPFASLRRRLAVMRI